MAIRPQSGTVPESAEQAGGALPNLVIIGAMRCGTTSLHHCLDQHPEIAMSRPKELNFFIGPARAAGTPGWASGTWHRGPAWYARYFDPGARLVYAVRDPIRRAVSQYWHHRR